MWSVEIRAYDDDQPVKALGPYASKRQAERADGGVNINLDHSAFYTAIVPTSADVRHGEKDATK